MDGTACATQCRTDTDLLGNCAGIVDYRYCARRMNNTIPFVTNGTVADALIRDLDGMCLQQPGSSMSTYLTENLCQINDINQHMWLGAQVI